MRYLKQHRKVSYANLLTSGKLNRYFADIDEQVQVLFFRPVKQMAEREGIIEKLKTDNQMLRVQKINNIRNRAAKIVNAKVVYI